MSKMYANILSVYFKDNNAYRNITVLLLFYFR